MLELFKPLLILKDKNNPVIFDEFGYKISNEKGLRPFIIFYDDEEDCYYYLRARDALTRNLKTNLIIQKRKYPFEVFVHSTSQSKLFSKDSYVDCSQIFKCNRELLENLIDVNCLEYTDTNIVSDFYINEIKNMIMSACLEVPPYLSITEIKLDKNGNTYGKSLYLCEKKLNRYIDLDNKGIIDFYYDYNDLDVNDYISEPSTNQYTNNRYNNAIDFVKMFQKEYFYDEYIKTDYQKKYFDPFNKKPNSKEKQLEM